MMHENEPLSDQVFHQFLALMRTNRQYSRQMIDERGIKPRDMAVLHFLSEKDFVTVSQVQRYIHHSASTTSTQIAKLEEAGFVTRTRTQTDNRVVLVALTQKGHDLVEKTPLGGLPLLRQELEGLSPERLKVMSGVFTEIQALMQWEDAEWAL